MRESFFQLCVIFAFLLIIFTLAINFVNALGIYGDTTVDTGIDTSVSDVNSTEFERSNNIFAKISGLSGGSEYVWTTILSVSGIVSIAVAILMHSAVPVGVWIFSSVFWASYIRCISVINVNGIFTTAPLSGFLIIVTVGIIVIFMGALAGMFSGSG